MKNILILFCGGTLVMEENKVGALTTPAKDKAIMNLLKIEPKLGKIANIKLHYVDNIDSSNIEPEHWNKMTQIIADNYNKYDGFVITHGTDTMAYTSSALSFTLQNLGKPVVLTGAQIPGKEIETDARRNLINAVRVAAEDVAGVFLVFDEEIILGSRVSKVSESRLDAFETINDSLFGEIRIDLRFCDNHPRRHNKKLKIKTGFEPNIAIINLVPGTPTETIDNLLNTGIKGLVLNGYGSGNISYKYLAIIKKAKKLNIPVIVTTQCLEGATLMEMYDVGKRALDMGAIQAYDMSLESTTTKLMWVLDKTKKVLEIKKMMHTNCAGEIMIESSKSDLSKHVI
ncbi:MAG: hypothetical protein US42_C0018G0028 [Candidatus Magasanikbacteria bacterium GW2011_GWC2_37_14]|uniref:asparaginase n=1 Tax=Candidatus Magasanikbacteria bacterium GW2011_GWC2_37_14 TaxID=1619046 RepID=A0A0G0IS07_9BACT|nr:MAG: hypothetical protein US42_C0018G0028 [Candidatus Magasanikbacteria bacterium GW2011_GWC2_37_14]